MKRSIVVRTTVALGALACAPDRDPTGPALDRAPASAGAATYGVLDLGTLGGSSSRATDINNANVVVGWSSTGTTRHAFRWRNGIMTDLGTLGGSTSMANAIDPAGDDIVGSSETKGGATRAVRWRSGAIRNLGTLGGRNSEAFDINALGVIVGHSQTTTGEWHAFMWKNGVMTDLETLGGSSSVAYGINRAGIIVGQSRTTTGATHAFRWKDGVMRDLGTPGGDFGRAVAINNVGQVVGDGTSAASEMFGDAFLWAKGKMTVLPFQNGSWAAANDVGPTGLVVGSIEDDGGDPPFFSDAALWLGGSLTFLPKIGGGTWAGATAVNFRDDVVGYSETDIGRSDFQNGEIHAALWRRQ